MLGAKLILSRAHELGEILVWATWVGISAEATFDAPEVAEPKQFVRRPGPEIGSELMPAQPIAIRSGATKIDVNGFPQHGEVAPVD